jgi:hypothetical protein
VTKLEFAFVLCAAIAIALAAAVSGPNRPGQPSMARLSGHVLALQGTTPR